MKRLHLVALITLICSLPVLACGSYSLFMAKHVPATYVGTIKTQIPESLGGDDYKIAMTFTGGQWHKNSAICFDRAKAKVVGTEIHLKIYTSLCGKKSPPDFSFKVKDLTAASYDLVYIDPDGSKHVVGKITP